MNKDARQVLIGYFRDNGSEEFLRILDSCRGKVDPAFTDICEAFHEGNLNIEADRDERSLEEIHYLLDGG